MRDGGVDVVLGSDDEKALAFPSAGHVFCSRHLQNMRRYLADDIGVPVTDRNQVYRHFYNEAAVSNALHVFLTHLFIAALFML